jgi:hypothetical protein
MQLFHLILCASILAGCATSRALPVLSARAATPAPPDTRVEVRHIYLFAPGQHPVRIVEREAASSTVEEVSSQAVPSREFDLRVRASREFDLRMPPHD